MQVMVSLFCSIFRGTSGVQSNSESLNVYPYTPPVASTNVNLELLMLVICCDSEYLKADMFLINLSNSKFLSQTLY